MKSFNELPQPQSCRLIDFTSSEVHSDKTLGGRYLVVQGTKPYLNMKVELIPVIYVTQPDYWRIEVVGCLPGIGLPAEAPYTVSIPIDTILGKQGIEVAGATTSKRIDVKSK